MLSHGLGSDDISEEVLTVPSKNTNKRSTTVAATKALLLGTAVNISCAVRNTIYAKQWKEDSLPMDNRNISST